MVYAYNLKIQETGAETGGSHFRDQFELHSEFQKGLATRRNSFSKQIAKQAKLSLFF